MESLLVTLAVLACPVGMGLMMWFMMRGPGTRTHDDRAHDDPAKQELARMRAEIEQLKAERREGKVL
ncbi:hypothetical protein NONI108955_21690 [Nocardia ninae]|uniref:DUF2933 domain-containing protein n=1 Tax=Nocardia ninae NBRC 108245 TaxID=1210091 RepID=A0A511M7A6_9NOCA|nr:hypothetical protein [Nocardia ninae]GEM36500.1 hypothetical protein NN4_10190 [Nocardia ninae NBRC 108245]